ncbi:DUF6522 family protein [Bradyrhizobium sp.]|uniref:DUF6522 family protein n=1 Tax=Bradyrhizobium sp. TaxID=376 RepID=UPI0023A0B542|nr:DUF6522 family protein [Bradyrhizobium sp.]MDE2379523.1 hypothetical protein [Bradyrhizobium sp.]
MSRTDELPCSPERAVAREGDTFTVDAALIGRLLHLGAARVPALMRDGAITSACERGVGEHAGEFRLTFFYGNRRARLSTDLDGHIVRQTATEFAARPTPSARTP